MSLIGFLVHHQVVEIIHPKKTLVFNNPSIDSEGLEEFLQCIWRLPYPVKFKGGHFTHKVLYFFAEGSSFFKEPYA